MNLFRKKFDNDKTLLIRHIDNTIFFNWILEGFCLEDELLFLFVGLTQFRVLVGSSTLFEHKSDSLVDILDVQSNDDH